MKYAASALAMAGMAATVRGHGFITSPSARMPGSAFESACGQQVYYNQESDNYGNIQGELQVAATQTDYNAAECNVWLCKGFKYSDNTDKVQSYTAGQTVPFKFDIRAPHTGTANVSIVDTATNTVIGSPLISWDVFASTANSDYSNETSFSITIPSDLGDSCSTAGACVIQHFWDARSIDQTYESCVDFTIGGSGSGSGSSSASSSAVSSAAATTSAATTSAAATSAAATSSVPATSSVVANMRARAEVATPRMTEISDVVGDQTDESLIEPGQMVVTITRDGFIKRTPLDVFRSQNRGGRGRSAAGMRGDDVIVRSFNAHTHQWVMFFSSGGKAYREKVWRLPEASPTAKGRALVNLLPELGGDEITAVLPLPQDEAMWENLHLVFATRSGNVRRNRLSDFRNIRASGLIAMKLEEDDRLIGVATCREGQDVFLGTRKARCIRFQITDETLRVFAGRDSSGVRGIRLGAGDAVNSLCVLGHVDATAEERAAYVRMANAKRRAEAAAVDGETEAEIEEIAGVEDDSEGVVAEAALSAERFEALAGAEEILLTVTDGGFGRRSSAYDYRVTGRGGMGITNMTLSSPRRGREVVATLPVLAGEDVMMVTDAGRLIRLPVGQVRVMARQASGVTLFRVNDSERVASVFPVMEAEGEEADLLAGVGTDAVGADSAGADLDVSSGETPPDLGDGAGSVEGSGGDEA